MGVVPVHHYSQILEKSHHSFTISHVQFLSKIYVKEEKLDKLPIFMIY